MHYAIHLQQLQLVVFQHRVPVLELIVELYNGLLLSKVLPLISVTRAVPKILISSVLKFIDFMTDPFLIQQITSKLLPEPKQQ